MLAVEGLTFLMKIRENQGEINLIVSGIWAPDAEVYVFVQERPLHPISELTLCTVSYEWEL